MRVTRRRAVAGAAALALVTLAGACAQQGQPPGGPDDRTPPRLIGTMPDTNAIGVEPRGSAVFRFDEVVSERPQGASSLAALVLVSPEDGEPRVSWHRREIHVRPRRDWRRDAVYTITLRPGVTDLRGNVLRERTELVFATGRTIPQTRLDGLVWDWVQGRPLVNARVEATGPDSTRYVAATDSTGRFRLRYLPPATYRLRAYADANANRTVDPREMWDTATVALRDTGEAELYAFVRDSVAPRAQLVEARDSLTLRVTFDRAIDPALPLDTSRFRLVAADSTPVRIVAVRSAREYERARADSAPARPDTARRGVVPPLRPAVPAAPVDTTPPPTMRRPSPPTEVIVQVFPPLRPDTTYRLTARDIRGLLGVSATSERTFRTLPREAPLPTDTTRAPAPSPIAPRPGAPPARPPR